MKVKYIIPLPKPVATQAQTQIPAPALYHPIHSKNQAPTLVSISHISLDTNLAVRTMLAARRPLFFLWRLATYARQF
jgi:hypothetical protein